MFVKRSFVCAYMGSYHIKLARTLEIRKIQMVVEEFTSNLSRELADFIILRFQRCPEKVSLTSLSVSHTPKYLCSAPIWWSSLCDPAWSHIGFAQKCSSDVLTTVHAHHLPHFILWLDQYSSKWLGPPWVDYTEVS